MKKYYYIISRKLYVFPVLDVFTPALRKNGEKILINKYPETISNGEIISFSEEAKGLSDIITYEVTEEEWDKQAVEHKGFASISKL